MRILEIDPKQLNNEQLHQLIASLRHSEEDFEKRLAGQVAALERAGRMHTSDPVYQSLFFLLRKFAKQCERAEKEIARRGLDRRIGAPMEERVPSQVASASTAGRWSNDRLRSNFTRTLP